MNRVVNILLSSLSYKEKFRKLLKIYRKMIHLYGNDMFCILPDYTIQVPASYKDGNNPYLSELDVGGVTYDRPVSHSLRETSLIVEAESLQYDDWQLCRFLAYCFNRLSEEDRILFICHYILNNDEKALDHFKVKTRKMYMMIQKMDQDFLMSHGIEPMDGSLDYLQ